MPYDFLFNEKNILDTHNAGLAERGLSPVNELPADHWRNTRGAAQVTAAPASVSLPTTPAAPSLPYQQPANPFMQNVEATTVTPNRPTPTLPAPVPTWLDNAIARGPLK